MRDSTQKHWGRMGLRGTLVRMEGGDGVIIVAVFRILWCGADNFTMSGIGCVGAGAESLSGLGGAEFVSGDTCGICMIGTLGCDTGCNVSDVCMGCIIGTLGCVGENNASGVRRVGVGLRQAMLLKNVVRFVSVSVVDWTSGSRLGDVVFE